MHRLRARARPSTVGLHAAVYCDVFLVMLTLGVIAPNLSDMRADLGASYSEVSWSISIFAVGRLAANVPVARIASAVSARVPLLVGGTACVAGGTLLAAVSPSLALLLVGRAISGVGSSAVTTSGTLIVLDASEEGSRGAASGRFSAALGAGAVTGPALGGLLSTVIGWRGAMAVTAAVLAGFVFVLWQVLRVDAHRPVATVPEITAPRSGRGAPGGVLQPVAVAAYAITFTVFWARGAIQQTIIPLRGAEGFGMTPLELSLLLFACSATATSGAAASGRQVDRFGWARIMPGLLVVTVAGCLLVAASTSVVTLAAGAVITAVGLSSAGSPASMVVDAVSPADRSRAVGWYRMVGDVGLLGAPVCTGWLADHVGFASGAVLAAGLGAASLGLVAWIAVGQRGASAPAGPVGDVEVLGWDAQEAERHGAAVCAVGQALDQDEQRADVHT